jgi:hypothetical protein
MALVKLDWYRRTVSDKLLKTEYIIQQMDVNSATFVTPNPALADVGTPPPLAQVCNLCVINPINQP